MTITNVKSVLAAAGGCIGWFLGGCDGLVWALAILIVLDYVTGVLCAIGEHSLSSAVGYRGICRKALIFAMVGVGHVVDAYVVGSGAVLRTALLFFYIANEGLSLVENAARLGLPVPEKLKALLAQLRREGDGEEDA